MTPRTVYIVDDNVEFLESTRFWLSGAGFDVQIWHDPQAALDALAQRDRATPACLMLDVRMPHLSGLDVHDALIERDAELPIVYMSGHADVPLAVQAMQKGAVTLLEKPFDDDALEQALEKAFTHASRSPVRDAAPEPNGAANGHDEAHARFAALEARLTPREREVLSYVIQGIYNKNIADRIGLSIKTVELYRARGMAKMQARSVAELTRMMVTHRA
ncbi:MAG TPA: response regulator [Burkholderiaceae bacterium]|nr:response regulator [Burkholderiaceae bacterium]